jgi:hypothetical protein
MAAYIFPPIHLPRISFDTPKEIPSAKKVLESMAKLAGVKKNKHQKFLEAMA